MAHIFTSVSSITLQFLILLIMASTLFMQLAPVSAGLSLTSKLTNKSCTQGKEKSYLYFFFSLYFFHYYVFEEINEIRMIHT